MGQMLVHSTPRQFLESLTSELFILLSAKERKQVFAGQIISGYKAKYLGDYLWLSALSSHTFNPVPLRAGVRWPLYLRLEGAGPEEETSKMGRAWASQNGLSQPLLRGSPSKVLWLYPQSRGHGENRTNMVPVCARDCHQGSSWVFLENGVEAKLRPIPSDLPSQTRISLKSP